MKRTCLALAALCGLSACATTPATVTVTPAGGQPVSFATGKDVKSTARAIGLAAAAAYLQTLTRPAK